MKAPPPLRAGIAIVLLVAVVWVAPLAGAGLDSWRTRSLVVSDSSAVSSSKAPPASGVRVTYLGTNGYLLESINTTILIDPYFSRIGLASVALNRPIKPVISRLNFGMGHLPDRLDAILVTHGHFDHLMDVPEIARRTGGRIVASPTSCYLTQAAGVAASDTVSVRAGDSVQCGAAQVRALPAVHDSILGLMPFPGLRVAVPPKAPARPSDWVCGEPLAFLVRIGGMRIYVDSGGVTAALPPKWVGPVDLAILGVALPDSRKRLGAVLQRLRPRYVLPSHQDNFFLPLSVGFRFGPMSDFDTVRRAVDKYTSISCRTTRLILLDYFAPWTLR